MEKNTKPKSVDELLSKHEETAPGRVYSNNKEILRCLLSQLFVIHGNKEICLNYIQAYLKHGKSLGLMGSYIYNDKKHRAVKEAIKYLQDIGFPILHPKKETYKFIVPEISEIEEYIREVYALEDGTKVCLPLYSKEKMLENEKLIKDSLCKNVIVFDYFENDCSVKELLEKLAKEPAEQNLKFKKDIHLSPYFMRGGIVIGGRLERSEQAFPLYRYFFDNMVNIRLLEYGKEKNVHPLEAEEAFKNFAKVLDEYTINFYKILDRRPWNYKKYAITFLGDDFDDTLNEYFLDVKTGIGQSRIDDNGQDRQETSFITDNEKLCFKVIMELQRDYDPDIKFVSKSQQNRFEDWKKKQEKKD